MQRHSEVTVLKSFLEKFCLRITLNLTRKQHPEFFQHWGSRNTEPRHPRREHAYATNFNSPDWPWNSGVTEKMKKLEEQPTASSNQKALYWLWVKKNLPIMKRQRATFKINLNVNLMWWISKLCANYQTIPHIWTLRLRCCVSGLLFNNQLEPVVGRWISQITFQ